MKTTIDYLNAVKAKTGATSDYQLSKKIGISRAAISNYRLNGGTLSDDVCVKVAQILEIEPIEVFAVMNADRAKNPQTKQAWKTIFEKLGGVAAAMFLGVALTTPQPAEATTARVTDNQGSYKVYIMLNRRRRSKPKKPMTKWQIALQNLMPPTPQN